MSSSLLPTSSVGSTSLLCYCCGESLAIEDVSDLIVAATDTTATGIRKGALPGQYAHRSCKRSTDADAARQLGAAVRIHNAGIFATWPGVAPERDGGVKIDGVSYTFDRLATVRINDDGSVDADDVTLPEPEPTPARRPTVKPAPVVKPATPPAPVSRPQVAVAGRAPVAAPEPAPVKAAPAPSVPSPVKGNVTFIGAESAPLMLAMGARPVNAYALTLADGSTMIAVVKGSGQ